MREEKHQKQQKEDLNDITIYRSTVLPTGFRRNLPFYKFSSPFYPPKNRSPCLARFFGAAKSKALFSHNMFEQERGVGGVEGSTSQIKSAITSFHFSSKTPTSPIPMRIETKDVKMGKKMCLVSKRKPESFMEVHGFEVVFFECGRPFH
jgi:hypothetical protein